MSNNQYRSSGNELYKLSERRALFLHIYTGKTSGLESLIKEFEDNRKNKRLFPPEYCKDFVSGVNQRYLCKPITSRGNKYA